VTCFLLAFGVAVFALTSMSDQERRQQDLTGVVLLWLLFTSLLYVPLTLLRSIWWSIKTLRMPRDHTGHH
jgi:hypothetical protein